MEGLETTEGVSASVMLWAPLVEEAPKRLPQERLGPRRPRLWSRQKGRKGPPAPRITAAGDGSIGELQPKGVVVESGPMMEGAGRWREEEGVGEGAAGAGEVADGGGGVRWGAAARGATNPMGAASHTCTFRSQDPLLLWFFG